MQTLLCVLATTALLSSTSVVAKETLRGAVSAHTNDSADKFTCPSYDDIRQPSVDPSVFDIHDIEGIW